MKNPKTTVAGILVIAAAAANAGVQLMTGHPLDMGTLSAAIMTGIGLIAAADSQKPAGQ